MSESGEFVPADVGQLRDLLARGEALLERAHETLQRAEQVQAELAELQERDRRKHAPPPPPEPSPMPPFRFPWPQPPDQPGGGASPSAN